MKHPESMVHLNSNMLVSVDLETTGLLAGYHEVIQVAVVPLNGSLEPSEEQGPFYININPEHKSRVDPASLRVSGLTLEHLAATGVSPWKAADLFDEWFLRLDLPFKKRLVPISHNWAFERNFLCHWLGMETFNQLWFAHPRDTMALGIAVNDIIAFKGGKPIFKNLSLGSMCSHFGIKIANAHDALSDALAGAALYKELLRSLSGY